MAQDLGPAAVRAKHGREHTDRRRLPRSVGAEQAEHLPARHLQVDAAERHNGAKSLAQPLDDDRNVAHLTIITVE